MPEGHTIHRLARDHARDLVGRAVRASSPQGRFADGAAVLDGRVVRAVEPLGKHLLYTLDDGVVLHVHLGLFGRFRRYTGRAPTPRGAVRLRMETDGVTIDLSGPIICAIEDADAVAALRARLGPDVLAPAAEDAVGEGGAAARAPSVVALDAAALKRARARVRASRRPIGALLLDQTIIAGVGNVYRAEALFLVGVHPSTPGAALDGRTFGRLWRTLVTLMRKGVEARRIVTVERAAAKGRAARTWVYGRSRCQRCEGAVERLTIGARVAYACRACQPREGAAPRTKAPRTGMGAKTTAPKPLRSKPAR